MPTLVYRLLRSYNVPYGTRCVDGQDVNIVSVHSVRNAGADVPQDNFLFSDTIAHNIGFGVGMTNETMNQFGYGYCAGAIDANPDITVQQFNANSFADSATGKTMANTAITNGADIVFQAAGATGLGVIEACQEAGVYAIGVDSDQSSIAPNTVLTSAMKRVDNAVYEAVQELIDGSLEGGVKTFDLAAGGVDIAPSQDLIAPEVISAVDEVKEKIVNGEIEVPDDKESFEAKYGDVYQLD